jgi:hypothetical protein
MPRISTTYRLLLSDGTRVETEAESAAIAIEDTLWAHRGRRVKQCYSGLTERDCELIRQMDHTARPIVGIIDFSGDVPPHEPIAADAVRPKVKRLKDETEALFSPDEEGRIKIQSNTAKYRRDGGAQQGS